MMPDTPASVEVVDTGTFRGGGGEGKGAEGKGSRGLNGEEPGSTMINFKLLLPQAVLGSIWDNLVF